MSTEADAPPPEEKRSAALAVVRGLLFATAIALLAVSVFGGHHAPLEVGKAAPPLLLQSYDGRGWSLEHFEGKPIVVNFWGTWCPPCLSELPDFAEVARRHPEVIFIGAAVDSPPQAVADIARRFRIPYLLAEADGASVNDWNARALPSTFVLNPRHEVAFATSGAMSGAALEEVLRDTLAAVQKTE